MALPLDYDQPRAATVDVAVLRVKAKDQKRRIGSLFVNPGGPSLPATDFALEMSESLSAEVRDRFDIVGFDPRGVGASTKVQCFPSAEQQAEVLDGLLATVFPVGPVEEKATVQGAKAYGKACSTTGKPLAGAMSTAEVARDMEVLRRAVGDPKLNYLGRSYGSVLGQFYANMFPERFRIMALEGVLDPQAWVGSNTDQSLRERLRAGEATHRSLSELLTRCAQVGGTHCALAARNPAKRFDTTANRLRAGPLELAGKNGTRTFTYAEFINMIIDALLAEDVSDTTSLVADVETAVAGGSAEALLRRLESAETAAGDEGAEVEYDHGFDAFSSVLCTDALHLKDAEAYAASAKRAERTAPHFGLLWAWNEPHCARSTWTVRDADAYTGPFDRRTAAPVLFVGSKFDPLTNFDGVVAASRRLPNSGLLSTNQWSHAAYGTGQCVTTAVDRYLLTGKLPPKGKVCADGPQPFTEPLAATGTSAGERGATGPATSDPRRKSLLPRVMRAG
ncbi:peptidase [Virgisporangium aliadipatigenens]|uniref:Peptidase n=1 Tax=Virgisporangium aliadipatigenens TaxID=741659 RepID=A0A8J4DPE6_9ACTN|nr:alpha/beta fold hydrolase [Virgisporangium aliadipatigenens]GIJ44831.1 peptidase [Virgisporangium aliadipatigenens]